MVGDAFYALGVIACMILIVMVAAVAVIGLTRLLPFLALAAVLIVAVWLVKSLGTADLVALAILAAVIGGLTWHAAWLENLRAKKAYPEAQHRLAASDKRWEERGSE